MHPQFRNLDGSMLPASQHVVLEWVAWLSSIKQLHPKTIKSYITHLWSAHVDTNLPFFPCESPFLKHIIQGIKQYMGERECHPKMPITCNVLKRLLEATTHSSLASHLNFEAATTSAFSGFLRCKFTLQPAKAFDPSVHITRSCIKFMPSFHAPSYAILTIPSSKMDPFRKGMAITISSAPGAHTCTVAALKSLFAYCKQLPESPLFSKDNSSPLSRGNFISQVRSCEGYTTPYNESPFPGALLVTMATTTT